MCRISNHAVGFAAPNHLHKPRQCRLRRSESRGSVAGPKTSQTSSLIWIDGLADGNQQGSDRRTVDSDYRSKACNGSGNEMSIHFNIPFEKYS
jgi:hypothetical protein